MSNVRLSTVLPFSLVALFALAQSGFSTEPLFDGLGPHTRKISTQSPLAQRYFNQGLNFYYGFNHGEALRSFREAARLDPSCAMTHWGIALADGPHINSMDVSAPAAAEATQELRRAHDLERAASPVERALISALARRYSENASGDRRALDTAYADAMRPVWEKFPRDPDVGALFAEAMMDLRPWNQWTREGQPEPGTEEILRTLDTVLLLEPRNPFANHLYIHAVEASPHPERALAAADRLRDLQPAIAHNVHMPSHIDIRLGHWEAAVITNEKAVAADRRMRAQVGPPEGFIVVYIAHNQQMLTYAAMMSGQRALALEHIRAIVTDLPPGYVKSDALHREPLLAMGYETLARFGSWDEILAAPEPPEYYPFTRAVRLGVQGIALAAKGDAPAARRKMTAYSEARTRVPADETTGGNSCPALLAVLTPMLEGEILAREEHNEEAIAKLRDAVTAEDNLNYDEPPSWMLPVRHSLGATLLAIGRFADAEQVYRDDLARHPENGWALYGLSRSLRGQHREVAEIKAVETRFESAWAQADIRLTSSCLCQPGG